MPSKKNLEISTLKNKINILNKKINNLIPIQEIKNITIEDKKRQSYGLTDLIVGVTPTFSGWTNNPTDAANITDSNLSTFCTTGNKISSGGWQYAYFEWDLGAFYNVIATGFGKCDVTAGTSNSYLHFWDGTAWFLPSGSTMSGTTYKPFNPSGCVCSKIRLGLTSSAAATITPNIREFHVWRLQ